MGILIMTDRKLTEPQTKNTPPILTCFWAKTSN